MAQVKRRPMPEGTKSVHSHEIGALLLVTDDVYTWQVKDIGHGQWFPVQFPQITIPKGAEALYIGRQWGQWEDFLVVEVERRESDTLTVMVHRNQLQAV